ncbi:MAG: GTP diphosphokinase [Legionella sp.]
MVKVKVDTPLLADGSIDVEQWIKQVGHKGYSKHLEFIRNACTLSQLAGLEHATETGLSCLQQGLVMADMLADLAVDYETLVAAIIYESVHFAELSFDDIAEQLGANIARLVRGVEKMNAISNLQNLNRYPQSRHQLDNIRKMLLAMADDVRLVLIKLAERLCVLRSVDHMPAGMRQSIATEAMEIYAPLANRLGIGSIKWEMEDLAFRHLYPDDYKSIAKGLKEKRVERDYFVKLIINQLSHAIQALGINKYDVHGRSKHIHSIYRKMVRKNVSLDEIHDATAVRILVETESQCYEVLSLVHSLWLQIVAEFDDYIANPKANGYRSLHTAVQSPDGRIFEVQIRTFDMHAQAEMGVAAHWKYKEGVVLPKESHERKIEWLREVLAWHREMAASHGVLDSVDTEFFEDRVYVFTPNGDVLDLPQGVTPLDFAYHVHSEVGHRCRGAKINGHIVPLTYALKTGDKVEILTAKQAKPSRDWINPHYNFLKTSRAKAKVLHWFKMQDFDKNKIEGRDLLDKELKVLGIKNEQLQPIANDLTFKNLDDLYAAIGRGDIKLGQILNRVIPLHSVDKTVKNLVKVPSKPIVSNNDLSVEGVGNLLTHMARCCKPVPGDQVIGYITLGRGVTVHRQDCLNILQASERHRQRLLQVNWGYATHESYLVDIVIKGFDRTGLLRDITNVLANEKANVRSLRTQANRQDNISYTSLSIEIDGLSSLSRLLAKLSQIPNVFEARRQL